MKIDNVLLGRKVRISRPKINGHYVASRKVTNLADKQERMEKLRNMTQAQREEETKRLEKYSTRNQSNWKKRVKKFLRKKQEDKNGF